LNEPELPPEETPRAESACDLALREETARSEIRAAFEPTCCGSGCDDCPF
jgi:hypothetical protein